VACSVHSPIVAVDSLGQLLRQLLAACSVSLREVACLDSRAAAEECSDSQQIPGAGSSAVEVALANPQVVASSVSQQLGALDNQLRRQVVSLVSQQPEEEDFLGSRLEGVSGQQQLLGQRQNCRRSQIKRRSCAMGTLA